MDDDELVESNHCIVSLLLLEPVEVGVARMKVKDRVCSAEDRVVLVTAAKQPLTEDG